MEMLWLHAYYQTGKALSDGNGFICLLIVKIDYYTQRNSEQSWSIWKHIFYWANSFAFVFRSRIPRGSFWTDFFSSSPGFFSRPRMGKKIQHSIRHAVNVITGSKVCMHSRLIETPGPHCWPAPAWDRLLLGKNLVRVGFGFLCFRILCPAEGTLEANLFAIWAHCVSGVHAGNISSATAVSIFVSTAWDFFYGSRAPKFVNSNNCVGCFFGCVCFLFCWGFSQVCHSLSPPPL